MDNNTNRNNPKNDRITRIKEKSNNRHSGVFACSRILFTTLKLIYS